MRNVFRVLILLCLSVTMASASTQSSEVDHSLDRLLTQEISKSYPGSRIQLESQVKWLRGNVLGEVNHLTSLGDDGRGNFQFSVKNDQTREEALGTVSFTAWYLARIAIRRIYPNEELKEEMFTHQTIEASRGSVHEVRSLILPAKMTLNGLESVQTVVEGQSLTSTAVRKIADIKKGDGVQIQLHSGGLVLSTTGTAEERGYLNQRVRVRTIKSKRELIGFLHSGGVVEVKL